MSVSVREVLLRDIVHNFIHVNHKHRKIMVRYLESTGVYESQHRLLMLVSKYNNFSQKQLAEKMKVSAATIAVSLKKLEKGGYVKRLTDTDDNRYNKIEITVKGQKVVDESTKIFKSVDEAMFADFTEMELEGFSRYLDKISANLDDALKLNF